MKRLAVLMLLAAMLPACGSSDEHDAQNASNVHFITFGPGIAGLVAKVKQNRLDVCLSGVAEGDRKAWSERIRSSVMKWILPLRAQTSVPLASFVNVVRSGEKCEAEVFAQLGTHANTSIGSRPIVRMDVQGYFASYNVLLHEFGHAFALSDTYQSGQSGNCRPGQPQAVMCNTSFSDLQKDDVAGVVKVFKQTFPGDTPGTTPPADPAAEFGKLKIAAALGAEVGQNAYKMALGLTGAEQKDAVAELCLGSESACRSSESGWRKLVRLDRRGDATIFQDDVATPLADGLEVTLRYSNAAAAKYATVRLTGLIP